MMQLYSLFIHYINIFLYLYSSYKNIEKYFCYNLKIIYKRIYKKEYIKIIYIYIL